jgi:AcrR family transcriptional regulator
LSAASKDTQRGRLLAAMRALAAGEGYLSATIARVIADAGVSRPTFYEYFRDKEDCFLAVLAQAQRALHDEVTQAVGEAPPERAMTSALGALVRFAERRPQLARIVMNEPLTAGPRTLDARDRNIADLAALIDCAEQGAPAHAPTPDLAPGVLLGAVARMLAARLREHRPAGPAMLDELAPWLAGYEQPRSGHRWRALEPLAPPAPWPLLPEMLLRAPPPVSERRARGREDLRENQRQRIMFATAEQSAEVGYTATTIAAITARAGVDRRAFNALFADKQQAFMAIHELSFQRTMALTAAAFAAGTSWPERVWEAGRAFTQSFHSNPAVARVGFVDPYAVGGDALARVEDSHTAFTIFLDQGRAEAGGASPATGPLALQAIAAAIFEIAYREARRDRDRRLSSLLPHIVFLCLAPFLTPAAANRFIDGRLAAR